ncbi:hypothetical protein TGFOU_211650 [Toxoplasma gondii FOU]|uniref:Transmembrane protein n=1 Tax=Toxoplasma gondii FOU TaxID=943167 RepID=A0A086K243_TOXGO|nr:hypothetical protein TGFOU_211650 [Toxoplasma gondii FOU]
MIHCNSGIVTGPKRTLSSKFSRSSFASSCSLPSCLAHSRSLCVSLASALVCLLASSATVVVCCGCPGGVRVHQGCGRDMTSAVCMSLGPLAWVLPGVGSYMLEKRM